ncbi:hypothetical protein GCM10011514_38060 [Emticicia aquatilis]|uniref:DUF3322 and DUF2220 domain-containing protein n=1 Tax=Emticicia aquatilis TaxID=1537369 RepID=A0A916Z092_9BACT|nr:Wadjet anti-phage system protein JetD domain-containing protein [Emticicia aquatilis]GGD70373.1 hypothetical protein GCM10011514_38060 [Emticicia aquatilis]
MLSPQEIRLKAEKWWNDGSFLAFWLKNEPFFPKEVPQIGLVKPSETLSNFEKIYSEQEELKRYSKVEKGFGYELTWQKIKSHKIGESEFITKISFETEDDYLKFIQKSEDFEIFQSNSRLIINFFPQLMQWVVQNPIKVIENAEKWEDLLKVGTYFLENPKPNLYIRQLPIKNIHTKFIEENRPIITSLLNFLLPKEAVNDETQDFEKRFGLLESIPLIRLRILDKNLFINGLSDVSLPISQLESLFIQYQIKQVFIAENQMCILTFPEIPKSIIIFGSGKAVSNLSKISWLKSKIIYYWGDLDVEGFQILSELRYFKSDAISLMMNFDCFEKFSVEGLSKGKNSVKSIPPNLSEKEVVLFKYLKNLPIDRCRLEQEKIPQWYVEKCLTELAKI